MPIAVWIEIISWDSSANGTFQYPWARSMTAKQVQPAMSCNLDSKCGIADWTGTVRAFAPQELTVNRSLLLPGLGTARAGLAHLLSGFG